MYQIYGLNKYDQQVIEDTLKVSLPHGESVALAEQSATPAEIERYVKILHKELLPHTKAKKLTMGVVGSSDESPWRVLFFSKNEEVIQGLASEKSIFHSLLKSVEDSGTTRIIYVDRHFSVIAIRNQYRYLTPSRARLLALEIIGRKLNVNII